MSMLLRRHYASKDNNTIENAKTGTGATPKVAPTPVPAPTANGEKKVAKARAKSDSGYTEEKIKAMTGANLRKLAKKNGIESPEELTAGELKSILCELLCD